MRTIRLDLQYDGTSYIGWQSQAKGKSIQGVLEGALEKITTRKLDALASGRTDGGVHAMQQVVSISLGDLKTPIEAFQAGLNSILPGDIRVLRAREVPEEFSARKNASRKTYRYFFQIGEGPLVFLRQYSWQLKDALDLERMKEGAGFLEGKHDFRGFMGPRTSVKTTEREIFSVRFFSENLNLLCFEISASGFLRHMVRIIAGTLVEIGMGKREPESICEILEKKDRQLAGQTAPPNGLFLWSVDYD